MIRRFVITGMATFLSLGSLKAQSTEPPKIPNYLKEDTQSSGNPFHAYAWVPIPDPLTREQPDGALLGPPGSAPPPYALFRDADFDPAWGSSAAKNDLLYQLKLIPLDRPAMAYLSLGGEVRERFEYWNNENFGVVPTTTGQEAYWLQRIMLHLDLRVSPYVRFFVQGKSNLEEGRVDGPRPTDIDTIDLHQAFMDITVPFSSEEWLTIRGGRQEIGYGIGRLFDPREGPNVRLSFDGVRSMLHLNDWELDGLWIRPVAIEPYVFDQSSSAYQIWGAYLTGPLFSKNAGIDLYYIGDQRQNAPYFAGVEDETRHTFGTRIHGKFGDLDTDTEGAYQTGSFGPATISAWFASSEVGYSFSQAFGEPHLALKTDAFSGDHSASISAGGQSMGTFNTFFPRGNYYSEPSPIGQQNIIAVHPELTWFPAPKLTTTFTPIFYWRESMDDGIYNFGGYPLSPGASAGGRFVGTELFTEADYQVNDNLKVSAGYDHFILGDFFNGQPNAKDSDWVSVWTTFKF
jgi:hypothetical protein